MERSSKKNILRKSRINFARLIIYVGLMLGVSCGLQAEEKEKIGFAQKDVSAGPFSFAVGETVNYEIKKLGLKAGEAKITFNGLATVGQRDLVLITFTAKALNFFDEEKIYLDPLTFYPVVVVRNLNLWGKKEYIREEYFHQKGMVKIIKEVGGKVTEQVIEKEKRLDNLYAFIYRYRKTGTFALDESLSMSLPTKEITLQLKGSEKMKLRGQEYDAHYLVSNPKQYKIWFDSGEKKIPLRIDGAVGFGNTSMVMVAYDQ